MRFGAGLFDAKVQSQQQRSAENDSDLLRVSLSLSRDEIALIQSHPLSIQLDSLPRLRRIR
jgi:hypothetical protein